MKIGSRLNKTILALGEPLKATDEDLKERKVPQEEIVIERIPSNA